MSRGTGRDVARQVANVVGAIFQVVAPVLAGPAIGRVSEQNSTLVVPADYAFVIWSPIFLLALIYAVYQALPSNRENPLLRRIGWFSALLYFLCGLWELLFPARAFVLSQVVFVGILVSAIGVYLLVQRGAGRRVDRWLIAPAFGLFAGWVTAAFFVGFATVLVATGVLSGGLGEAVLGALLLIAGGAVACAVIIVGRDGPVQGYLAYGGSVLWALAAVFANQYRESLITSSISVICAVLVAAVLVFAVRRTGNVRRPGRSASPRVV